MRPYDDSPEGLEQMLQDIKADIEAGQYIASLSPETGARVIEMIPTMQAMENVVAQQEGRPAATVHPYDVISRAVDGLYYALLDYQTKLLGGDDTPKH